MTMFMNCDLMFSLNIFYCIYIHTNGLGRQLIRAYSMESLDCLICTKFMFLCQNRNISSQVFNILSCSIFTWCAFIN